EALSNNGGGGGNGHTCALLKTAKVVCWGDNYRGDLGDGTTSQRSTPVNVVGLSQSAVQVAAGADMTCALLSVGTVFCWGDNTFGQLGNGSAVSNSTTPVQVSLTGTAIALAAGEDHTCALLTTGDVWCWGHDTVGQLGNGTTGGSSNVPVQVSNLGSRAVAISAMGSSACALLENPTDVQCWGFNAYGQLGGGSTTDSNVPASVQGL